MSGVDSRPISSRPIVNLEKFPNEMTDIELASAIREAVKLLSGKLNAEAEGRGLHVRVALEKFSQGEGHGKAELTISLTDLRDVRIKQEREL